MDKVRVFSPASVANLGCGFDILGLAIDAPGDEIEAKRSSTPGVNIIEITGDNGLLPLSVERNTAGYAAKCLLESSGVTDFGIELSIHKKMPFGSGLGSSAASAAGAVFAANLVLGEPFKKKDLLRFAVLGEQKADGAFHADNVAPSLLGGIILIRHNPSLDIVQLPVPDDLWVAVVHPDIEILTKDARNILSPTIELKNHVVQSGNLGGFVSALFLDDMELLRRSLEDVVIEPQRGKQIPGFFELKEALIGKGALGVSISGSGPSIFSLYQDKTRAQRAVSTMSTFFDERSIKSEVYLSTVNKEGSRII